jgi:chitinase
MKAVPALLLAVLVIGAALHSTPSEDKVTLPKTLPEQPRLVGYYASWNSYNGFSPENIRAELLTHLNYAFATVSRDGTAALGDPCADVGECGRETNDKTEGNFKQLRRLKKRHPHLKVLIAIGGWKGSTNFSDAAATPHSRQQFVSSALALFLDNWPGLFDGFDLDWEYPVRGGHPENTYRRQDRENYTLLISEFRRQLDERRNVQEGRYLLTIASPATPDQMANFELARVKDYVDWVNVMTYDYHTGGRVAHFNAPLYAMPNDPSPHLNVHATVHAYLQKGVPAPQITVGAPFFGHGYAGVGPDRYGLLQSAERNSPEPSSGGIEWGVGAVRFRDLTEATRRGFRRFWQSDAQVPWLFNPETRIWISYDDAQSLGAKAAYVREQGLGGMMIWELGGDDGTLLECLHRQLTAQPLPSIEP